MSIYRQILGNTFEQLHPMLQQRYAFQNDKPFIARGVMNNITTGGKWKYPLLWLGTKCKLLFPEQGSKVPFQIVNTPYISENGEVLVHWERTFYFEKKTRYFNALMSIDEEGKVIKDYFGEPRIFYSDLLFQVTTDGGLHITSKRQRIVLGTIEIPLPRILQGMAIVSERYNDHKEVFQIKVEVKNPLLGLIFAYEGEFQPHEYS